MADQSTIDKWCESFPNLLYKQKIFRQRCLLLANLHVVRWAACVFFVVLSYKAISYLFAVVYSLNVNIHVRDVLASKGKLKEK